MALQRSFLRSAAGWESRESESAGGCEDHRQEGAQGEGGYVGERDQSAEAVRRKFFIALYFILFILLFGAFPKHHSK